jgi:hypothetical protein
VIYFANPATQPIRDAMTAGKLGMITTPVQGNVVPEGACWCADNGCFGQGYPGDEAFLAWLSARLERWGDRCKFATAPDVVGDARATLVRSAPFLPAIRDMGCPAAFIGQDGQEDLPVPWDEFDALFLGGTTEWKLGVGAAWLTREAVGRGKWVHMGRVNTKGRLRYAASLGCSSVDGTTLRFGPDINLPILLRWLDECQTWSARG